MLERLHSRWQKAKKPLKIFVIIVACMLIIALLVVIALTYIFNVNVPGLRGKTLWDWLQLLIIPLVLAVGGYLFNFTNSRTERDIAADNQRETALKEYIDQMSELLLKEHLGELKPEYETVRNIARVRTLTVLPRLDARRKRSLLKFLYESNLINKDIDTSVINLSHADLSNADLRHFYMHGANLFQAYLEKADLSYADLTGTNLSGANLRDADLRDAKITQEQLNQAKTLKGATMPDGSTHP